MEESVAVKGRGTASGTASKHAALKKRAVHEAVEFAAIFLYLAFFFCSLATYSMLLLSSFHVRYLSYAFALINALVIAKVIMLGEYAHVGRKYEARPLLQSAIYKAILFSLLVLGFHFLEEVIKGGLHHVTVVRTIREIHGDQLLSRGVVVFSVFIPLFAFREFRRVLGEERFNTMFFRSAGPTK
jgi:hypothetical protein